MTDTLSSAEYRRRQGLPPAGADRARPAKVRRELTETELHLEVVAWLRDLTWSEPEPLWTHPASEERDVLKRVRDSRMGQNPGWPDFVFAIAGGRTLFVELKVGGQLSKDQRDFRHAAAALGHPYVVAHSIAEVHAALVAHGVGFTESPLARARRESLA